MSLKTAFARELFHARDSLGLTQQKVAEAASISVRWYQHIEKGAHLPSAAVMLRLILLLEIDIEKLRDEAGIVAPMRLR